MHLDLVNLKISESAGTAPLGYLVKTWARDRLCFNVHAVKNGRLLNSTFANWYIA